jgi:hypothetical protein
MNFDWTSARLAIELRDSASTPRVLIGDGVRELYVPRMNEWGQGVAINEVFEIESLTTGLFQLRSEMQSGDVMRIVATQFSLPSH